MTLLEENLFLLHTGAFTSVTLYAELLAFLILL